MTAESDCWQGGCHHECVTRAFMPATVLISIMCD
ncbi:hypothetical protein [Caudoviricetes sp.]|nr:hypothetical protein [Caudoviricetes sp.]